MFGRFGSIHTILVLSFSAAMLGSAFAHADQGTPEDEIAAFKPSWDLNNPNSSYLSNRGLNLVDDPIVDQFDSLMDNRRAAAWRQQYDDMNRDYDQRQRAGLCNPTVEQAHEGAVSGFSNSVMDQMQKQKIQEQSDRATRIVQNDKTVQAAMVPGAVVAGVYMGIWVGKSVNLRVTDDTHFSFRTSMRDKLGQIEFHSPILYSSFEFHQNAADSYALIAPTTVDFGEVMNLGHIVDFQDEKYQFKVARSVPFVDLNSSVFYGSSSNVVASSLSKQLTPHLAAVVDSIYYLSPYDPDHTLEERVRLRYDIHF